MLCCDLCGASFDSLLILASHFQHHSGVYHCHECGLEITKTIMKTLHRTAHPIGKPYNCIGCGSNLILTDQEELHICNGGSYDFYYPVGIAKVYRSIAKPYKFTCKQCGKLFSTLGIYRFHLKQHQKNMHPCNTCGLPFDNRKKLAEHLLYKHQIEENTCLKCGVQFTRRSHVERHVRLVHLKEKPYQCHLCGRQFGLADTLRRHMMAHDGEKPYQCTVCGSSFLSASILKTHSIIHTNNKQYKCKLCVASFSKKGGLNRHYSQRSSKG